MRILDVIPQLRTTNLDQSIRFYTEKIGFTVAFRYQDFYARVRIGDHVVHLKQVDEKDPSIDAVDHGDHFHLYLQTDDADGAAEVLKGKGVSFVRDVHDTPRKTREFVIKDNQGHTLYFGESRSG